LSLFAHFLTAFHVTGPIVVLLLAGVFFKRINLLDTHFISVANKLVFNVSMPCLLYLSVVAQPLSQSLDFSLIYFAVIATLICVVALWLLAPAVVSVSKRGVFVQCAFRGNMAVVGLSLCVNAYGEGVLAVAGVYLAFLTILYNVVVVILLSTHYWRAFLHLLKNPLVIAIVAALFTSIAGFRPPAVLWVSCEYFAQLTLPLALLCVGASLDWKSIRANQWEVLIAAGMKLIMVPLVIVLVAILVGLRGEALGILFLMMASPTAAAAYIMSRQMTPHGQMSAEIITLSTLLSPITITLGLIWLGYYKLI